MLEKRQLLHQMRPRASEGEEERCKLMTSEHLAGIGSVFVNKHLKLQLSSFVCAYVD